MCIGVLSCVFNMLLSVFLSLPSKSFAQVPIHEELLESISFLYPYSIINGKREVGAGTGFVVKQNSGIAFLVTAKHVLMHKSGDYHQKLCIRHSTKNGADFISVSLSGSGAARVLTHPTDLNVDIAVIPAIDILFPVGKPAELWLGTSLGTSLFATKEHFAQGDVKLGDEVFLLVGSQATSGESETIRSSDLDAFLSCPTKRFPSI